MRALAREVRGRRRLFLGTTAALWLIGTAVVLMLPERYTGVAKVLIRPDLAQNATAGQRPEALSEAIESSIEIMRSRGLAERVIVQLKLYEDPELNLAISPKIENGDWRRWLSAAVTGLLGQKRAGSPPTDRARLARLRTQIIDRFLDRLSVARLGQSRVISIAYSSSKARRAADVANAVANRHVRERMEARLDHDKKTAAWMTRRLAQLRDDAEETERRLASLRRDTDVARERERHIEYLEAEIARSRITRTEAKGRIEEAETLLRDGGPLAASTVLTSETLRLLKDREEQTRRRIAKRTLGGAADSPQQNGDRKELSKLRARIGAEVNAILRNTRNEINVALARESSLRLTRERLRRQPSPPAVAGTTRLVSLQHQASTKRAQYEAVLARIKESDSAKQLTRPPARIISHADTPAAPSFPDMPSFLALAFAAACIGGLLTVLLAAWRERGFRSLSQIEDEAGIPTLGLIPAISGPRLGRTDPIDYIVENPGSAFGEAVRAIHTGILLANVANPPKTLLVSSSIPNEGKTSLAICFARLVSQVGRKKVVLIDCDLRHPEIHEKLQLPDSPGLAEYLMGEADLGDILQVDEFSGALVIPAGHAPTNTTDLLTSPRLRDLLAKLNEVCDTVVLDSSPVLAVSDARILSQLVDRTIFVARWARTPRETVMRGVKEIVDAGGHLAGVALTRVDLRAHARFGFGDSDFYHESFRQYYSS